MRDIHCHVLPGVDDGASDLAMSLRMIDAARAAGVTSMVCTPHCRVPYFDYDAMWDAFELLRANTDMPLTMGFEVAHTELVHLGVERWASFLAFDAPEDAPERDFLLELDTTATRSDFEQYERTVYDLLGLGYNVIVAHPERYRLVQRRPEVAERLVQLGCRLQASADFVVGGRMGKERKPAKELFSRGLYSYLASDAHRPEHYALLAKAMREFGDQLVD